MTFSDKLKLARAASGMSQEQLAAATGISRRSIAEYETSATIQVRTKNLRRLAEALNVTYEYLANDEITDPHYGADLAPYVEQIRDVCGNKGAKEFMAMVNSSGPQFAGGSLSDANRESFYQALTDAFLLGMQLSSEKYGRKK